VSPSDPIASFSWATYHPAEMMDMWCARQKAPWGSFVNKIPPTVIAIELLAYWFAGGPIPVVDQPKRLSTRNCCHTWSQWIIVPGYQACCEQICVILSTDIINSLTNNDYILIWIFVRFEEISSHIYIFYCRYTYIHTLIDLWIKLSITMFNRNRVFVIFFLSFLKLQ